MDKKFKSYRKKRYTTLYAKLYRHRDFYGELCSVCGHTMGQHGGLDHCPNQGRSFLTSPNKPEFYSESLNTNTKVI